MSGAAGVVLFALLAFPSCWHAVLAVVSSVPPAGSSGRDLTVAPLHNRLQTVAPLSLAETPDSHLTVMAAPRVPEIQRKYLGKTGLLASCLGVGTAGLAGLHGDTDDKEAANAIKLAIDSGINFIDTSPYYNNRRAEMLLGDLLADYPREKFLVCTKVGRYMNPEENTESFDYSAETVTSSVEESIKHLRVTCLDVVLVHDAEYAPSLEYLQEVTIPALDRLKRQGLIKSIGISGYSTRHLRRVVEACLDSVDVIMSYFRCNLYDGALTQDLQFYQKYNVGVINASPLGIGLFTDNGNIPHWNPATKEVKEACKRAARYCANNDAKLTRLSLRHSVELPGVDMTLWSTRSTEHMLSNIVSSSHPLTDSERCLKDRLCAQVFSSVSDSHWEAALHEYHPFWPL